MIPLAVGELAGLGELQTRAEEITGVVIDSRLVRSGDLFVAVGGGEAFLEDARRRGAAGTLVPSDAFAALGAFGKAVRARSSARVVGITGSTGKTSTKDILASLCRDQARTVAAEASFNNELGVPLTLCRLEPDTEVCILELAMRGLGQIAELCEIARPDVGVITNVGPAHLELVGSLGNVLRAKSELIEALPVAGTAVVPEDMPVARDDIEVVRFGEPEARIANGSTRINGTVFDFDQRHQARNALAALHALRALGLDPPDSVHVEFSRWRGEEVELPGGGLLINDSYNANPLSMRAALEHLVQRAAGRRAVAVLGDMAELGPDGPGYHEEIGALARQLGVTVIGVGELARGYGGEAWAPSAAEASDVLAGVLRAGDCVLVKGSRAMGLEEIAEALSTVHT